MACDRMRELALLSVDGELSEAEQRELAAHLATCADCRAAQAAAARITGGVRRLALPTPPVPVGFAERTLRRIESPGPPRLLPWAAVAATLIAALIFAVELRRPRDAAPLSTASNQDERRAGEAAPRESSGRLAAGTVVKKAPSGGSDASSLEQAADAPEAAKATGGKGEEAVDVGTQLATSLAEGTPADAERRLDELLAPARLQDDVEKRGKAVEELEEKLKNALERRADKEGLDRDKADRGGEEKGRPTYRKAHDDTARDADEGFASGAEKDGAKAVVPTLRFLRVTGDAKQIAELLAKESKDANDAKDATFGKDATRDGADRLVVEVDEAQAQALAGRLDAAGVKREELTADEWLRAARSWVAPAKGLIAGAPATPPPPAESKQKSNKVGRAAPRATPAEPTAPGAAKPAAAAQAGGGGGATGGAAGAAATAAPPPKRERWIILIDRG